MGLTQRQEWAIARYLREVEAALGDIPDAARERVLTRVRSRIDRRLSSTQTNQGLFLDDEITDVLQSLGSPRRQAAECIERSGISKSLTLSVDHRVWLGVCGGLARFLNVDRRYVRGAFILLGITGPIILLIYLALYLDMYFSVRDSHIPRIDGYRVTRHVAAAFGVLVSIYAVARLGTFAVLDVYQRLGAPGTKATLGGWNWLHANGWSLFVSALAIALPLSVLSALPLARDWNRIVERTAKAVVAIYAVAVSFGIALFLVGLILHAVDTSSF